MVFQQYSLYPHMTVRENLAFPLRSPILSDARATRSRARSRAVAEMLQHRPQARQQGDRALRRRDAARRRSAGRWCASPSIYLMDEPLSSLDAKLRADLRIELKRIQAEPRRDVPLRHPRPDRGDDDGDPRRRARPGPPGAVRLARARSTRTRSASTPRAASASRGSTSCRPTSSAGAPAGASTIGLRPEQIRQGEGEAEHGHPRRAPRRPDPAAPRLPRPRASSP